jgi:hypothetical protein
MRSMPDGGLAVPSCCTSRPAPSKMTPVRFPISEGGPGCGAAHREKADGFTDRDRCDQQTRNHLRRHRVPGYGLRVRPTYIPRAAACSSSPVLLVAAFLVASVEIIV